MSISVVIVRGILSEVRNRGIEPDALLRASGIDAERITDLRETIDLDQADRLFCNAMSLTGDPGLGLALGAKAPESMLQVFGHLMLAQSTIRDAFAALRRYASLVIDGPAWELVEESERAMLTFEPTVQLGDSTRFGVELALALTARMGMHFAVGDEGLREVHFQHAEPRYSARYREVFGCPVLFRQAKNALVFSRTAIDIPQLHADSTVRSVLRDAAERLLQERAQRSAAERVRTLLRWENDLANVDIDRIARHLGLSARALRRRLGAEGAPLSTLIDEARCEVACRELRRPDSTIKETAELLGFSEPSAFHRAFKRWTGRTPAEFSRVKLEEPLSLLGQAARVDRPEAHTPQASR